MNTRLDEIEKMLEKERSLQIKDLSEYFDVSIETIRRDFIKLEKRGLLQRIYGGAVARNLSTIEPLYEERTMLNFSEKKKIGQKAVELVNDGDSIALDVGTTTLELAKALVGKRKITAITNSLQIASVLSKDLNIRIILLGGDLRSGELSTSGFLAEDNLDYFIIDKLFLGIGGITDIGITDYNVVESNLRRHYLKKAKHVIGLADYSKFGVKAFNHICSLDKLDYLVSDQQIPSGMIKILKKHNVQILLA